MPMPPRTHETLQGQRLPVAVSTKRRPDICIEARLWVRASFEDDPIIVTDLDDRLPTERIKLGLAGPPPNAETALLNEKVTQARHEADG
jgi:hypothetical protein